MLSVKDLHAYYGRAHILQGVSLEARAGEVVALVGRNGAGKSTTLKAIMGLVPPARGEVAFGDARIDRLPPYRIARLGLGYVPEDRRIFAELTVWENLDVAARRTGNGRWSVERVFELFPKLAEISDRQGGFLSGGEQQMLTIARTLMGNPELLLLDEPSEGLAPLVVESLRQRIGDLKRNGLTILLAEQSVAFCLALADRVYVLEKGAVRYHGTADEFRADPSIQARYLEL